MNTEITKSQKPGALMASLDIVTPPSFQLLLWRAKFLRESRFLHQLPLAFWLMDTLRPKVFVTLGMRRGVAYLGFCQAVDKLNLPTQCYGASAIAGGDFNEARRYNAEQYEEFSTLLDADPIAAAADFPDQSVDLLHLDAALSQEEQEQFLQVWHPRLSSQSVLVIHGLNTRFSDATGQSFISKLCVGVPAIRFAQGDGLLVILYGSSQNERISKLADLEFGSTGHTEVHRVFARLGKMHHFEWQSRSSEAAAGAVQETLEMIEATLQATETTLERAQDQLALQDKVAEISPDLASDLALTHFNDLTLLTERLEQSEQARMDAVRQGDAAQSEMRVGVAEEVLILTQRLEQLEQDKMAALAAAAKAQDGKLAQAQAQASTDLRVLTRRLELLEQSKKQLQETADIRQKQALAAMQTEIDRRDHMIKVLEQGVVVREAQKNDLLEELQAARNFSWKKIVFGKNIKKKTA